MDFDVSIRAAEAAKTLLAERNLRAAHDIKGAVLRVAVAGDATSPGFRPAQMGLEAFMGGAYLQEGRSTKVASQVLAVEADAANRPVTVHLDASKGLIKALGVQLGVPTAQREELTRELQAIQAAQEQTPKRRSR